MSGEKHLDFDRERLYLERNDRTGRTHCLRNPSHSHTETGQRRFTGWAGSAEGGRAGGVAPWSAGSGRSWARSGQGPAGRGGLTRLVKRGRWASEGPWSAVTQHNSRGIWRRGQQRFRIRCLSHHQDGARVGAPGAGGRNQGRKLRLLGGACPREKGPERVLPGPCLQVWQSSVRPR